MDTPEVKVVEGKEAKPKAPRAPRAKKAAADEATAEVKEPKAAKAPAAKVAPVEKMEAPSGEYIYGLGRRKTSIVKVRLYKKGSGQIIVNGKLLKDYIGPIQLQNLITDTLNTVGLTGAVDITAEAHGGGVRGQAEAMRLGLSRALIELNPVWRKTLKKLGNLTRDPRAKERKKFGLKKARRAPQWSKR